MGYLKTVDTRGVPGGVQNTTTQVFCHFATSRTIEMHFVYALWRNSVGFEVLTAVAMKSSVFLDIRLCSPLKASRRFGGTCVHLQGRRLSHTTNQHEAGMFWACNSACCLLHVGLLCGIFFYPDSVRGCSPETRVDFGRTALRHIPEDITLCIVICV
jgi:hypothetical protein